MDADILAPCIAWLTQHVSISADEALAAAANGEPRRARDDAVDFLSDQLASGPLPMKEILEAAAAHSISKATLQRAKKTLGIVPRKSSLKGGWTWRLPEDAQTRPEDAQS